MSTKKVLVVGGGGREHALAARLKASPGVGRVVVTPGNAGTTSGGLESIEGEPLEIAAKFRPDLVVVGPEVPLCAGLVDELTAAGYLAYGPTARAAQLEGSKIFMKDFAERHQIRTARYRTVREIGELEAALSSFELPPVVKASGLCAGKGVVVAESFEEARESATRMLMGDAFGKAGSELVLEERLLGQEVSIHAICDGDSGLILPPIQDHKRIGEGDTGPNTGGMGTYGPPPIATPELLMTTQTEIIDRVLQGMRKDGNLFRGTLFAGLMVSASGEPVLLEINVRFGDPETQVLMNLIDGDFYELLASAARGQLNREAVSVSDGFGLCVVLAAADYPSAPRKGDVITGVEAAASMDGISVYHAGTRLEADGRIVTAGGRVLGVSAVGATLQEAKERAYSGCSLIHFDGAQMRKDIGYRALAVPAAAEPC